MRTMTGMISTVEPSPHGRLLRLNYHRGIFRIWVVASIIWLTAVLVSKDYSCWWRKGPWCEFWSLSKYLDSALELLGPPIGLFVAGQLIFWIISGFGGLSNKQGPSQLIAMIGIAIAVLVGGTLIALKQPDEWVDVAPSPEAVNVRIAKCMLQQLQGKPEGAFPYAYMICSK